jgi:hypothetical protein
LATDFYLHWNGYDFMIPEDADDFTIAVAKGERSLNDILWWLVHNSKRTPGTVVRHWLCEGSMMVNEEVPTSERLESLPKSLFFPIHALIFFRDKIIKEQYRKANKAS